MGGNLDDWLLQSLGFIVNLTKSVLFPSCGCLHSGGYANISSRYCVTYGIWRLCGGFWGQQNLQQSVALFLLALNTKKDVIKFINPV